ncbi:cysteine hydrolase family protein [Acidihalobacter prosperus]|uniref:Amidase n=1 Tax=Acidihalobacter prosperus TaxID=160660 RepID=A0A1A6C8W1_9GAMM|nr:isochorismatase family cysteine hydrolase [Acidihalobacter prosperus]OBS11003.1 amidase [Acidihalobacter prosperus]
MHWKEKYRSLYYLDAEIPDVSLDPEHSALLVIDIQNTYVERPSREALPEAEHRAWDLWTPFHTRMRKVVIPNTRRLLDTFRAHGADVFHARIACLTPDGRDRSLSQRRPGFNNLLLPKDEHASQIVPELAPLPGEVVVTKTTDSALTGTNLRLVMQNMDVRHVVVAGIFTDQCVASTVRSLADESFDVVVVDDACAAATDALHEQELTILNNIYCQVMSRDDVLGELGWASA